jgi:hypothetical protein
MGTKVASQEVHFNAQDPSPFKVAILKPVSEPGYFVAS